MKPILREGESCWRIARVEESAALVDAHTYYAAFYRALLQARRHVFLAGWQFDTDVALLRGAEAAEAPLPVKFLSFLVALCEREPNLRIHLLAWDYSIAYALEREWLQELKFSLATPARVRFEFDPHPGFTGSHHQKFVVVDGTLAFAGGMDICDERWDDRGHVADNPLRVNSAGESYRPNHEVQAAVTGEAAFVLAELFRERWRTACGEDLEIGEPPGEIPAELRLAGLTRGNGLPLRARSVGLSRTALAQDGTVVQEVRSAFETAFAAAERFIYIETQYFTSRSITAALLARLRDADKPKLELVVLLPRGADNSKEKFALGEAQSMALGSLEQAARATGHELRFLCSTASGEPQGATFIHSKVLVVDDQFLSIGSANMTERSMGFDSELTLSWEAAGNAELESDIRRVRASLLAEHAERDPAELEALEGLVERVDGWIASASTRLRVCHYEPKPANPLKNLIFDPGGPLELPEGLPEPATDEDRARFSRGGGRVMRELSRRSLSDR